jgi:hypothetical protein
MKNAKLVRFLGLRLKTKKDKLTFKILINEASKMIIFESVLTTFKSSIFLEAVGAGDSSLVVVFSGPEFFLPNFGKCFKIIWQQIYK